MFRKLIIICALTIAAALPVAAGQSAQPAPSDDHSAHHGGTDQGTGQQAPSGGMMGGMMGGQDTTAQGMGAPDASAQDKGGMMGQGGMMDGCPMMGDMMGAKHGMKKGRGMMHSVPMMEGRLAYTKADLAITEAQMPAWNAYADAVRAKHGKMDAMHADMMKAKESGNALQRMDARIKALETTLDSLNALKPATVALYAVLTDEQRKKADQLLGGGCGMM